MALAPVWVPAAIAIASGDQAVRNADKQRGLQRRSQKMQERAQSEATRIQLIERQRAELAAANAAKPSPSAQLADPVEPATTDLTGGIERDRLRLMRSSRLGG